jgi:hypothetical protein
MFRYLLHRLGFHSIKCIVPCDRFNRQEEYTCRYTLRNFKKEPIWRKLLKLKRLLPRS